MRHHPVTNLLEWRARAQIMPRSNSVPPSHLLDQLVIAPLMCHVDDDLQGIGAIVDVPNFNPEPPTYALRFCPVPGHESVLGLANEDGCLAFQDTSKVTPRMPLVGQSAHNNAIFDFAWCPGVAQRLVTVSGDQRCNLWDLGQAQLVRVRELRGHTRSVKCVEWRPQSETEFATGARDNSILLWDTRSKSDTQPDNSIKFAHSQQLQASSTKRGPISSPAHVVFSPSCRRTSAPALLSPACRRSPAPAVPSSCSVTGLAWLDSNNLVSIGDNDGVIKVWDMRKSYSLYRKSALPTTEIFHPGTSSTQGYTSVMVSPCLSYVYAGCMDGTIYKYYLYNSLQRPVSEYTGAKISNFFIKSQLSSCGRYLVSGSADSKAYIWNTDSPGSAIATLGPQEAEVTCVAWKQGELLLATCSDDMRHRIWRSQRCEDSLMIAGRAEMTGKLPHQRAQLAAGSLGTSPSHNLQMSARLLSTPAAIKGSRTPRSTPSIVSFLTPRSSTLEASNSTATPVNLEKRGLKRRLTDSLADENSSPNKREKADSNLISSCIQSLLRPGPSSFTSPVKSPVAPRLIASPLRSVLRQPLELLPSGKQRSQPLEPLQSPLPSALRQPLEALPSPTANLPNMVRDGVGALPLSRCNVDTRVKGKGKAVDWLTSYCKQRKKDNAGLAAKGAVAVKPKNKPVVKRKIKNR